MQDETDIQKRAQFATRVVVRTVLNRIPREEVLNFNVAVQTMNPSQIEEWGEKRPWFPEVRGLLGRTGETDELHEEIKDAVLDYTLQLFSE